ncbi:hypothetical protein D5S18_26285 [Nocardia panacis]|uniref:Lipoprotein n=1 Tax=Nocardia panacis TaxID=2340916 RepID=A0A3A4KME9_9NOCA|nr:hypothetical protein [Nocardia panacis]RJO70716.1 hypothetical protein D5S18_26285 [Nocardia panacis]
MTNLRSGVLAAGIALTLVIGAGCARASETVGLRFTVAEGLNSNEFVRAGPVAAHPVLRSGREPRLVVAFPAGDSGVGVWFAPLSDPASWTVTKASQPLREHDSQGRALFGATFEATIAAPELVLKQAILSSIRVLRDFDSNGTVPPEVLVAPRISADKLDWSRDRIDGAPGYHLTVTVTEGSVRPDGTALAAGADGRIGLRISASTGDTPLTPLPGSELLNGTQRRLPAAENTLTYLSYREKFLAGSWHFDTYFGRDTLIALQLLMPVLTPAALDAGFDSVLTRLSPEGLVAHEESISEHAVLQHRRQDGTSSAAPTYDYSMIDETYLLAPVLAAYLLDDLAGAAHAREYFRADPRRTTALVTNLRRVVATAAAFARDPRYTNLIGLPTGKAAGQWRDSADGLAGGRYPYDVNCVLVPAALEAAARLAGSGLLDLDDAARAALAPAAGDAKIWRSEATRLFAVTESNTDAAQAITDYAAEVGVRPDDALAALGPNPFAFHAIALDADGRPIPLLHSDEVFDLLFGSPTPEALTREIAAMAAPFPLGLRTGAGLLVANPVFADPGVRQRITAHDYHGTVIWSWVQAAFAAGLNRQLARTDLSDTLRDQLTTARKALWQSINAAASILNSELWSWTYRDGAYRPVAFGAGTADVTESDAAQLWSTAYLAITPP